MDCHGAARLAMTEGAVIAPLPRHCDDCHVAALLAMTEAIHRRPHKHMDCHVAARLAMTKAIYCGRRMKKWIATALRASQ